MPGQMPEAVKAERSDVLLKMDEVRSEEFRRYYLGRPAEILMEEPVVIEGVKYMMGHISVFAKCEVTSGDGLMHYLVSGTFIGSLTGEILLAAES